MRLIKMNLPVGKHECTSWRTYRYARRNSGILWLLHRDCAQCFEQVEELKLVVFDAFQSVATRVKLLFYPALKEAAKKVTKAIETFVRKDTKNDNVTNSKNVGSTFCV